MAKQFGARMSKPDSRGLWLVGLLVAGGSLGTSCGAADAQVFLEDSNLVGAGGTLAIDRLQYQNAAGKLLCENVAIPFSVGSGGTLVIGTASVTSCPNLKVNHFVSGTYVYGTDKAVVSGPGAGAGGSTAWSLSEASPGCNGTIINANWIAGPLADNPDAAAYLKTNGITPDPNASYGFGLDSLDGCTYTHFLAFYQTGSNLSVKQYSEGSIQKTITYVLTKP